MHGGVCQIGKMKDGAVYKWDAGDIAHWHELSQLYVESLLAISTGLLGFVHQQYDDGNLTSELPRRAFKTTRLSDGLPIHHLRAERCFTVTFCSSLRETVPMIWPTANEFLAVFLYRYQSNTDICKPSLVQQSFNITNFID